MKNNIIKLTLLLLLPFSFVWAQEVPNTLTSEQKAYELSLIWKEMSYNFDNMNHCPELDMDSLYRSFVPVVMATADDFEYSKAVMRYLAHFRNNHTFVVDSPSWVDSLSQLPIRTEYKDGKILLANFTSQYADKMHVGDELVSINGMSAVEYMQTYCLPYVPATNDTDRLRKAMSNMGMWTVHPYGTMFDLELKGITSYRLRIPADLMVGDNAINWIAKDYSRNKDNLCYIDSLSGTGYLRITDCFETGRDFFLQHKDALSACRRIILDLSHNSGGQSVNTDDVVGFLAKVDSLSSETILSKMNIAYLKAQAGYRCVEGSDPDDYLCQMKNGTYFYTLPATRYANSYYPNNFKGEVIVIQGYGTASAAEWLVARLRQDKSIRFFGERTAGATGNPYQLNLPSGLIVRFNTWRTFSPDGTETSYGFDPDVQLDFFDCYKATEPEELYRRIVARIEANINK